MYLCDVYAKNMGLTIDKNIAYSICISGVGSTHTAAYWVEHLYMLTAF